MGLALAASGAIAAEAADVVPLVDDLERIREAVEIGRSTIRIARQIILVRLGLSAAAMAAAGSCRRRSVRSCRRGSMWR